MLEDGKDQDPGISKQDPKRDPKPEPGSGSSDDRSK